MKVRYWGGLAIILAGVLTTLSMARADPQLPARTGAVVDAADIIRPNQEQKLAADASNLKALSNVELVVVTLPSLQGYSIERWGRSLGNDWNVGGSAARGVLLIVAPNDREVRIEVGDGISSMLSDGAAASIIDNVIVPQFRGGEMSGGILAGANAIAKAVTGTRQGASAPTQRPAPAYEPLDRSESNWSGLRVLAIVAVIVLLNALGITGGAARDRGGNRFVSRRSSSFSSSRSSRGFSGRGSSGRW